MDNNNNTKPSYRNLARLESQLPANSRASLSVEVNGLPLTQEQLIVAVLVKRLGGNVTVEVSEMADVRGVVYTPQANGVSITAA